MSEKRQREIEIQMVFMSYKCGIPLIQSVDFNLAFSQGCLMTPISALMVESVDNDCGNKSKNNNTSNNGYQDDPPLVTATLVDSEESAKGAIR